MRWLADGPAEQMREISARGISLPVVPACRLVAAGTLSLGRQSAELLVVTAAAGPLAQIGAVGGAALPA